jgi:uncharacterized protein YkwD
MRSLALLLLLAAPAAFAADGSEITVENVIATMNQERAAKNLPPLREDSRLAQAARDRVRHMEELAYWSHESPDGMSPFVWLAARDYPYKAAGENLANGFETVGLLVESWMESRGHRENILGAQFQDCGVAVIDGATTGPATGKSIVVLFGATQVTTTAVKRP